MMKFYRNEAKKFPMSIIKELFVVFSEYFDIDLLLFDCYLVLKIIQKIKQLDFSTFVRQR